jgi:hypothetical protein
MHPQDEALWDDLQLAEFLKLSPGTLRKARMVGSGPPFLKFGHSVRYVPYSVREWCAQPREPRNYGSQKPPKFRNCSPPGGYVDGTRDAPARVRRIASRAPMERRRAVSMTERMSA